ncbi:NUMOD1 domain-containing DNA-binding protein [Candidatus Izimaplasma bacterium ZiA1]|uniref:NUMOD1 domain-containing DNA-binding protein n=1 Tax=Candidatus Izimoplasma sp. ZiA1 TaxID=2024899 RepID=UPI00117813E5
MSIDGDSRNLTVTNIKWISKSEAGKLSGHLSRSKPVIVRKKYSKESIIYRSVRSAAKSLNVSYQTVLDYLNKKNRPKNSVLKSFVIEYT